MATDRDGTQGRLGLADPQARSAWREGGDGRVSGVEDGAGLVHARPVVCFGRCDFLLGTDALDAPRKIFEVPWVERNAAGSSLVGVVRHTRGLDAPRGRARRRTAVRATPDRCEGEQQHKRPSIHEASGGRRECTRFERAHPRGAEVSARLALPFIDEHVPDARCHRRPSRPVFLDGRWRLDPLEPHAVHAARAGPSSGDIAP